MCWVAPNFWENALTAEKKTLSFKLRSTLTNLISWFLEIPKIDWQPCSESVGDEDRDRDFFLRFFDFCDREERCELEETGVGEVDIGKLGGGGAGGTKVRLKK